MTDSAASVHYLRNTYDHFLLNYSPKTSKGVVDSSHPVGQPFLSRGTRRAGGCVEQPITGFVLPDSRAMDRIKSPTQTSLGGTPYPITEGGPVSHRSERRPTFPRSKRLNGQNKEPQDSLTLSPKRLGIGYSCYKWFSEILSLVWVKDRDTRVVDRVTSRNFYGSVCCPGNPPTTPVLFLDPMSVSKVFIVEIKN